MSEAQEVPPPEFAWAEITPETDLLIETGVRVFLVQVKSDTDIGRALHNDPLTVLREQIEVLELPDRNEDVRAVVLRANAERSANPRHRTEVWTFIPGSTFAVGVQYKHPNDDQSES